MQDEDSSSTEAVESDSDADAEPPEAGAAFKHFLAVSCPRVSFLV